MDLRIITLVTVGLVPFLFGGCSASINFTDIAFSQKVNEGGTGTMKTDAAGLTNSTVPTQDASGSAATQGAMAALEGIKDSVAKYLPTATSTTDTSVVSSTPTASTVPVNLPTTPAPGTTTPEVKPPTPTPLSEDPVTDAGEVSVPTPGVSESLDYNSKESFTSYGVRNGGRQAWRINKKGPAFGSNIKVVFANGHTVYVKDTSHNYREKDGFVFKPGIGPNGVGDADTGTDHGGVYLHAPYGNSSKIATFYYNK